VSVLIGPPNQLNQARDISRVSVLIGPPNQLNQARDISRVSVLIGPPNQANQARDVSRVSVLPGAPNQVNQVLEPIVSDSALSVGCPCGKCPLPALASDAWIRMLLS
jgi:hypothetical protein